MEQLLYGILKFFGLLPLDILLDSIIFTPIRLLNAYIADGIRLLFKGEQEHETQVSELLHNDACHEHSEGEEDGHDHDHQTPHAHEYDDCLAAEHVGHIGHIHVHDVGELSYLENSLMYLVHHGDYILPAAGVIAVDYLTEGLKGGRWLGAIYELPVIGDLHEMMEPDFGVEFLNDALGVYESIHLAIHLVEAFSPYYNILIADHSLEQELADIEADLVYSMEMTMMPINGIFSVLDEGGNWLLSHYNDNYEL